jgi:hypothetical protein
MLRVTTGAIVRFNGCKIRLCKHREIDGRIKSGSFSQDARGRWYCNLVAEYEPKPLGKNAEVGIDGLKEGMTLSTDAMERTSQLDFASLIGEDGVFSTTLFSGDFDESE